MGERRPDPGPPRLAERWLRRFLSADAAGRAIRGDLREEYVELAARRPRWLANAWYWWEVLRLRLELGGTGTGAGMIGGIPHDLRLAARGLLRAPGFTLVTVVTLALGLGANTAIFATIRAVILTPLPYERPTEVVALRNYGNQQGATWALSFPQFEELRRSLGSVSDMAAWRSVPTAQTFDDGRPPARVVSAGATARLFPMLGIEPSLGRGFGPADDEPGAPRVAMVSYGFWRSRLAADTAAVGRELRLDGEGYTVVGVLPRAFSGDTDGGGVLPPASVEVWLPYLNSPAAEGRALPGLTNVNPVARLDDGVSLEVAQAELDAAMVEVARRHEALDGSHTVYVPARDALTAGARTPMALLWGAVIFVLLLACVNAANLILERTENRGHELSLRRALGAGRGRVLRQLLSESAILAGLGGVLGFLLGAGGLRAMVGLQPDPFPRFAETSVDGATVAFLVATTALVALILGLIPVLGAVRARVAGSLRGAHNGSRRLGRLRPTLVVTQVALATVLLTGAGLLTRSLDRVLRIEPGFDPHHVVSARVDHPTAFVSDNWPSHVAFVRDVVERLRGTPGVAAAAAAYQDPTDPGWNNGFTIVRDGVDAPTRGAIYRPVSPGYFAALGVPLLDGRDFGADDDESAPRVAVVNQAFVRRYMSQIEPLGERLRYGSFWGMGDPDVEIVGVVGDVRFSGRDADVPPAIYFPHPQQPVKEVALLVRTQGEPTAFVEEIRRIVADVDPTLPVFQITTLEEKLVDANRDRRFLAALLGAFALIAVTLAGVGLYGVLGFMVARRTREIGIRVALGARAESILGLVVRQGVTLLAVGVAAGLLASLLVGRAIRSLLFGVSPLDVATHLSVPALLFMVGLLACVVPGWRALRVDPVETLTEE